MKNIGKIMIPCILILLIFSLIIFNKNIYITPSEITPSTQITKYCKIDNQVEISSAIPEMEDVETEEEFIYILTFSIEEVAHPNLPVTTHFYHFVEEVEEYYGAPKDLFFKMIYCESLFRVDAASSAQCYGLMQIMEKYAAHFASFEDKFSGVFAKGLDLFNPYQNVVLGGRVYADWIRMTGITDPTDILGFYNKGWSYAETHNRDYSEKVLGIDLDSLDFKGWEIIG